MNQTEPQPDWRRAARRRAIVPAVVALVGIVLIAAAGDTVRIVGWGLVGVAVTVAVSLAFLEIGYSEERARERERRRR